MRPMRLEEKTLNKHKSIQHNLDFKLGPYLQASLNLAPPVRNWFTLEGSFLLTHTSTQRKGEHIHMNLFAVYLFKSIPSDMTLNINDRISHLCEEHISYSLGNSTVAILSSAQVGSLMSEYLRDIQVPSRPSLDEGLQFHDDSELDSDSGLEDVLTHS